MSYNGSGTFNINSAGQPVVTGTVISSTAFNALTADLGTGLTTAITKDGQTATTARIPFAAGIDSTLTTDATSTGTGSIITAGGVGVAKALWVGGLANIAGVLTTIAHTITSASANAFSVGRQGTTDPALNVDASTALSATGINIKSAAAAGGVAVSVISSGANEALTVNAKGTGTIGIGNVSTGAVTITPATTLASTLAVTGAVTLTTALPVASGGTGLTSIPHTVQVFSSGSGTYTTPANCKAIFIQVWGGGGSGAAGNTTTSTRGAGAGAGAYSQKLINSPAATYTYAVGAGGVAVTSTAGGAAGNTGGTSTFSGSSLSCSGGVGGGAAARWCA